MENFLEGYQIMKNLKSVKLHKILANFHKQSSKWYKNSQRVNMVKTDVKYSKKKKVCKQFECCPRAEYFNKQMFTEKYNS